MNRIDGRKADQMREVKITEGFVKSAEASFFLEVGRTRVLCCASLDEEVPRWLKGKGAGWVTAEYNMLPKASPQRIKRERNGASGRTQEIQRLIGRALRGVCDMQALGERQIMVDCDSATEAVHLALLGVLRYELGCLGDVGGRERRRE